MMNPSPPEGSTGTILERRYRIHGRVQGVGFRWWTRVQATRLGISGDVRNLPDGTVEVRARGRSDQIERLASLLAQGAPASHVSRVDQAEIQGVPDDGFDIA